MPKRNINSQIDALEGRRLLAFAVLNPDIGHITVTGTAADDTITVALSTDGTQVNLTLNGETESFARTGVREVIIDAGAGNDTVSNESTLQSNVMGGDGNDSIVGARGHDTLEGDAGDDTLDGGGNDDVLYAGVRGSIQTDTGNDKLLGRGGDDMLISDGGGTDSIDGGSGNDTADFSVSYDHLTLSLDDVANDGIAGQSPEWNLVAIENVIGGNSTDTITGNGADNSIQGSVGELNADTIFGGGGNDTLTSGDGASLDGGSGDDQLSGGDATLKGEGGDDHLFAGGPTGGLMDGGSGDDQIETPGNSVSVFGQSGDDQITYTNDPLAQSPPTGDVSGGSGNDSLTLVLATSDDTVGYQITFDNVANDGVRGNGGLMNFHHDFESVRGSDGDDTLNASANPKGIFLDGANGNDTLTGSNFADTLVGEVGNDSLNAGAGNDSIDSADGVADTVNGGNGTDTATVDNGTDVVSNVENVS